MAGWNEQVIDEFRSNDGRTERWGDRLIVMHTTGAKTGEPRPTPVMGLPDQGGWLVVASKGGAPENPAWFHNIVANPSLEVEALVDGEIVTVPVTAAVVPDAEWKATYDAISAEEPQFAEYLTKTDRQIPVVQLTPA